jgi:hypothetical protein
MASYTTWTKLLMFAHIACIKTSNHESLCGDFLIFPIVLNLTLGLGTTLHQYTTDVGIKRGIIWGVGIHDTYNNVPFLRCLQIKRLLRILTPNVPWGHLSPNDEFSKCGWGCKWHHYFPKMLCDNTCDTKMSNEKNKSIETITFLLLFITNMRKIGVHQLTIFSLIKCNKITKSKSKDPMFLCPIIIFQTTKVVSKFLLKIAGTWYMELIFK